MNKDDMMIIQLSLASQLLAESRHEFVLPANGRLAQQLLGCRLVTTN